MGRFKVNQAEVEGLREGSAAWLISSAYLGVTLQASPELGGIDVRRQSQERLQRELIFKTAMMLEMQSLHANEETKVILIVHPSPGGIAVDFGDGAKLAASPQQQR